MRVGSSDVLCSYGRALSFEVAELDCLPSEQAAECKEPEQEARVHVSQVEQAAEYKQPEQCSLPNTRVQRREEHAHLVRWLGLGLGD